MNDEDKRKVKIGVAIAAAAVLLYLSIQNLNVVLKMVGVVLKLFSPFIYGVCFAFVLNILMRFLEKRVFRRLNAKNSSRWSKVRRPVCLTATVLLFLGILAAIFSFIIPQLVDSIKMLASNLNGYAENLTNWANQLLPGFGFSGDLRKTVADFISQFSDSIIKFITDSAPRILDTAVGITSGVVNLFIGFIVGIYMLSTKERLTRIGRRMIYAYLPRKAADYLAHVYRIMNQRFTGFVSGQLTEAFIMGMLCFLFMSVVSWFPFASGWSEYALLISIIVGLTNMVPIIGPIIGTIPGTLIILASADPLQAVLFVAFIIVLQQIEANLIYPHVVGDSIGLPGLWVMFAVFIGGGLFGLPGVLLGVPAMAVIYTLLSESVSKRLKLKEFKE